MLWLANYYVSEWAVRVVMLFVVTRRRKPDSALFWLLLIFALPWPGLVLFMLVGRDKPPQHRLDKRLHFLKGLEWLRHRFQDQPHAAQLDVGPTLAPVASLVEKLGWFPVLEHNRVELIADSDAVITRLIDDIDRAQSHVHLLYYIYADDETGGRVTDALARATKRGVTCRVLVDAIGSAFALRSLAPRMAHHGIQLYTMLPVASLRRHVARVDVRNHRKLAVVDGRIAYTGSQNIINADYHRTRRPWRDLVARVSGPVVLELQAIFAGDWYQEADEMLDSEQFFPQLESAGPDTAQALPSGPTYPTANYQRLVVSALHNAHDHVTITTPYLVPDEALLQAIGIAALRGVNVEIVVPEKYDKLLVGAASKAYYEELLECGAKLYLYTKGLLHAKSMTVDNTIGVFGSSNIDIRSFILNFELNLLLYGAKETEALRAIQRHYMEQSTPLTMDAWKRRPWPAHVGQNLAKLFSPVL